MRPRAATTSASAGGATGTDVPGAVTLFAEHLRGVLGPDLVGLYIGGSYSTGEFVHGVSDYDVLVVLEREPPPERVAELRRIHRALGRLDAQTLRIEGDYAPLGWLVPTGTTRPVYWFRDGELREPALMLSADNIASIRDRGITVAGPPPATILPSVTPDQVRDAVREMMAEDPDLSSERSAAREILDLARSLRALETGEPTSRRAGLEWGLRAMDARWHPVLRRADAVRAGEAVGPEDASLRSAVVELRASLGLGNRR